MSSNSKAGRMLALAGGTLGLVAGFAISAQRLGWVNLNPGPILGPGPSAELPGNLGFLFAFTMPFALALFALRLRESAQRAAIWFGVGILAFGAAVVPVSIVTFLFLPLPAILLVVGALLTWNEIGYRKRAKVLAVAAAVAVMGGAAGIALFSLPDATCWELIRSADGQETWRAIPYTTSLMVGPAPGPVAASCVSDIINPLEALMSLGVWTLGLIGLALALPRVLPPDDK